MSETKSLTKLEHPLFQDGIAYERERLLKRIEQQICFDALADADGRCNNHSGKCYELRQLIDQEKTNA